MGDVLVHLRQQIQTTANANASPISVPIKNIFNSLKLGARVPPHGELSSKASHVAIGAFVVVKVIFVASFPLTRDAKVIIKA